MMEIKLSNKSIHIFFKNENFMGRTLNHLCYHFTDGKTCSHTHVLNSNLLQCDIPLQVIKVELLPIWFNTEHMIFVWLSFGTELINGK